jgi:hypothetical protein
MKILRTGDVLDPGVYLRDGIENDVVLSEAVIIPGEKLSGVNSYRGGIVDSSGEEVVSGRLVRGPRAVVLGNPRMAGVDAEKTNTAYGSYRYAGAFSWHYGHFLLEGLGRISVSPGPERSKPHLFHDFTRAKKTPHIEFFLSCLGVSASPVSSPLRIRGELIIPPPRLIIKRSVHENQALIYREIADCVLSRKKEFRLPGDGGIYLSRSKIEKTKRPRRIVNETDLEAALVRLGFTVVHMQELDMEDQIGLVSSARLVVGPLGSAMHSTVFSAGDCRVIYLCHGKPNCNYPMLDSLCGRSAVYCDFDDGHDERTSWRVDIEALTDFLSP